MLGDHPIAHWRAAGLLFPSAVTGIFRTIKRAAINRKLGSLAERDQIAVDHELRRSLGL